VASLVSLRLDVVLTVTRLGALDAVDIEMLITELEVECVEPELDLRNWTKVTVLATVLRETSLGMAISATPDVVSHSPELFSSMACP
jgi:hypothetical protein